MTFPLESPAARKLGGVDADKVQFFRTAHLMRSEPAIAELMANPDYRGDTLFVAAFPDETGELPDPACLQDDDRLALEYTVERFDSNNLVLTVRNTTDAPVWLVYSDVWHPGWRAAVDGERTFLHRAALAYKAVQVPAGSSRVHFYFRQRTISFLYGLFAGCSLLWLGLLVGLTVRLCRGDSRPAPRDPNRRCVPAPRRGELFILRRGQEALWQLKRGALHAVKALRSIAVLFAHVGSKRRAEVPGEDVTEESSPAAWWTRALRWCWG
jgi:hypothetical protein